MIEIVVDSDSHVTEEEVVDEERMKHWWRCCLRKTVERATPLAAAVSLMAGSDALSLSEIAAAFVAVRKEARIAAALLLPLRHHEIC